MLFSVHNKKVIWTLMLKYLQYKYIKIKDRLDVSKEHRAK